MRVTPRGVSHLPAIFFFYSVYEGIWGSCWLIFSNQIFSSWVNQMLAMTQYECSNAVFSMKIAFIIIISTSFMVNYDVFYFEKKKTNKIAAVVALLFAIAWGVHRTKCKQTKMNVEHMNLCSWILLDSNCTYYYRTHRSNWDNNVIVLPSAAAVAFATLSFSYAHCLSSTIFFFVYRCCPTHAAHRTRRV